jgi:alkylation response protein AidB-like acyl-CoA dehydrogenase
MAELGWFGWALPEAYGGSGGTLVELGLIFQEAGRALAPVPLLSTIVPALGIALDGSEELKQDILPRVATGELILTWAFNEANPRLTEDSIRTTARADGNDYVINGRKLFVENFKAAQKCVVAARTDGGISLFLVDTDAAGISTTALTTLAKDKQYAVDFANVRTAKSNLLGTLNDGWSTVEKMNQRATALDCIMIAGAARKAMELAVEYAKYRVAFGRPIGTFQALSHMCVDMLIWVDGVELLTFEALWRLQAGLPAHVEVSSAKVFANEKCLAIFRNANIIHGGISFMREFDLNLWFRRGSAWTMKLGTVYEHRKVVADAILPR